VHGKLALNLIKDNFKNLALIALDFNSNSNITANCYLFSVALDRRGGGPILVSVINFYLHSFNTRCILIRSLAIYSSSSSSSTVCPEDQENWCLTCRLNTIKTTVSINAFQFDA
jgi:hypothetical protein